MFGLNVKKILLVLWLLYSAPAFAKKTTFADGNPLGFGFRGGISNSPSNEFLSSPQSVKSNFGKFAAFEPFFDFTNFVVKLTAAIHFHPLFTSSVNNNTGIYNESSDATSYTYGAKVMLAPMISQDKTARLYFALGLAYATADLKNTRNYTTAAGVTTQTYIEKVEGNSQEFTASVGGEFMFVQNYSLQLEGGFRQLKFGAFEYKSTNDLSGTTQALGSTALNANGVNKKFNQTGLFGSLSLNLNF